MTFHPEINVLSVKGKYRPMYRLDPSSRWCMVMRAGKPVECSTSTKARAAAQELIDNIISPKHLIEDEPEPLGSLVEWRKDKQAEADAERARVFGGVSNTRLFAKGGRMVAVEPRHPRRQAGRARP